MSFTNQINLTTDREQSLVTVVSVLDNKNWAIEGSSSQMTFINLNLCVIRLHNLNIHFKKHLQCQAMEIR